MFLAQMGPWSSWSQYGGVGNYNNKELDELNFNGVMNVDTVKVKGKTSINGNLTAVKSIFLTLVTINGALVSRNSEFLEGVSISTESLTLKTCKVTKDILFIRSSKPVQTLTLDDTTVEGSVRFEAGQGLVYLIGTSRITGNIVGGVLQNQAQAVAPVQVAAGAAAAAGAAPGVNPKPDKKDGK